MSKLKLIAVIGVVAALSACVQSNGQPGINANCALMGAAGGAALGAITENNVATSAVVGGLGGAAAGNAGLCH